MGDPKGCREALARRGNQEWGDPKGCIGTLTRHGIQTLKGTLGSRKEAEDHMGTGFGETLRVRNIFFHFYFFHFKNISLFCEMLNKKHHLMIQIKILGPGCQKCNVLMERAKEVVTENQYEAHLTKVDDIMEIMQYNILSTPALVLNEKVVVKGHVPSKEEIKKLIEKEING